MFFLSYRLPGNVIGKNIASVKVSEETALLALAALAGTLRGNPLSRKLFVAGGHISRITQLLAVTSHMQTIELSALALPSGAPNGCRTSDRKGDTRRRWGWGGSKETRGAERPKDSTSGGVDDEAGLGYGHGPSSHTSNGSGGGGDGEGSTGNRIPAARITAALALLSALLNAPEPHERFSNTFAVDKSLNDSDSVTRKGNQARAASGAGWDRNGHDGSSFADVVNGHSIAVPSRRCTSGDAEAPSPVSTGTTSSSGPSSSSTDDARGAVGRADGLLNAICELALASPRAPAGGGPTWAAYGLQLECQRAATAVLAALVAGHGENQVRSAGEWMIYWACNMTLSK